MYRVLCAVIIGLVVMLGLSFTGIMKENNTVAKPKSNTFYFGEKVKIVNGFYKGNVGTVQNEMIYSINCREYYVYFTTKPDENGTFYEIKHWFKSKDLEKI